MSSRNTISDKAAFTNIRKKEIKKMKVKTREQRGVLEVDVASLGASDLSARLEGEYLCIREKRGGIARIIRGKLVQKVFMPKDVEIEKIVAKRSKGTLHCRLVKKS